MLKSLAAEEEKIGRMGLVYRSYLPADSEEAMKPLVVLVHGRAGDANSMWTFSKAFSRVKPLVISPEGLVKDPVGGYSWWPVKKIETSQGVTYAATTSDDLEIPLRRLEQFVKNLCREYRFDRKKIFGVGFSQGAALLSSLSAHKPDLFRGVAMLSGFLPQVTADYMLERHSGTFPISDLPDYFISHGTQDEVIPVGRALYAKELLESMGAQVQFLSEKTAHKIGSSGIKGLQSWFERSVLER